MKDSAGQLSIGELRPLIGRLLFFGFWGWFGYQRIWPILLATSISIFAFAATIYLSPNAISIAVKREGIYSAARPIQAPWLSISVSGEGLDFQAGVDQRPTTRRDTMKPSFGDALLLSADTFIPMINLKRTDSRHLSKFSIFSAFYSHPDASRNTLTWEAIGYVISFAMYIIWAMLILSLGGLLKSVGLRASR